MHYSRPGHQEDIQDTVIAAPQPASKIERRIGELLGKARAANVPEADIEAGIDIAESAVKALVEDRK